MSKSILKVPLVTNVNEDELSFKKHELIIRVDSARLNRAEHNLVGEHGKVVSYLLDLSSSDTIDKLVELDKENE